MARTWVKIPAWGPIKFITNYSPVENHEAAVVLKPSKKKATSSSYVSSSCSSTCAAIGSRAVADQRLQISAAASSANVANVRRDREVWQEMPIRASSSEGGFVTDQQMQLIKRDGEAWQQMQIRPPKVEGN